MKIKHALIILLFISCKTNKKELKTTIKTQEKTKQYELIKISNATKLLIVFPGAGATTQQTKEVFKIVEPAIKNNISVLFMHFNHKLWIENNDCLEIEKNINAAIEKHNLDINNVYIGGMSIGGNVALTFSNYLLKTNNKIKAKGVFVVDSPIDLYALYESSLKDIKRTDFSEERLAEPKGIVAYFESQFGKDSVLQNIQKVAPFTYKTNHTKNINHIKNISLRLYTEPDSIWQKEIRQTDFKSTNAYALQRMHKTLKQNNWKNIKIIETKNKGYRLNGEKNPHSWSIVAIDELIKWINN